MKDSFSAHDKLKALAIVSVFETGRAVGDPAACVVLDDGAGVSYGINQFTHRSGALEEVVREYLRSGGAVERSQLEQKLRSLARQTPDAIAALASDAKFKKALRLAARTDEMKAAQLRVAFERFLRPAITICERRRFTTALSLAVVYDSVTHGSWEWISARVEPIVAPTEAGPLDHERRWVTEYVRRRHRWLTEVRRLRKTNYRTKFFLDQIAIGNWQLDAPFTVHGVRITKEMIGPASSETVADEAEARGALPPSPQPDDGGGAPAADASILDTAGELASSAGRGLERVEGVLNMAMTRRDSAKSMWTAVGGTITQAAWAVFGFFAGLPRLVWIVVALVAAALMLLYLYRQIVLGRIRETALVREHADARSEGGHIYE